MTRPRVAERRRWIAKMTIVSIITVFAENAMLVGGGQCAWSTPADTTKAVADDSLHDRFRAHVKDVRCGPLTFSFGGQVRARYEYSDGSTLKGYAPGTEDRILLERVRLDLSACFWSEPRLFLQLQDAHPFLTKFKDSDFPKSSPIENTLDVRQLYVEWLRVGDSPFGFRLGRQQISYGDQRVFGPGNWGNTGRFAWDAAMVNITTDWFWIDFWVGKYLQYKTAIWPDRSVGNFSTFVIYAGVKNLPFRLEFFYVKKNDRSVPFMGESGTGSLTLQSIGLQGEGMLGDILTGGMTLVTQYGDYGADRIRAFGGNAKLGVTLPLAWKPELIGQITYGSGDSNPTDGIHGTFDGVYGGRDIYFYGYLNLFFWANLWDGEIDVRVHPYEKLVLDIAFHHFSLAEPRDAWYSTGLASVRHDRTGQSGKSLGAELDARVTWNPFEHLELMAGIGRFFPGSFVSNTGVAEGATWTFFQTVYAW